MSEIAEVAGRVERDLHSKRAAKHDVKRTRGKAKQEARKPPIVAAWILFYVYVSAGKMIFGLRETWYDRLVRPPWALPPAIETYVWLGMFALLAYSSALTFRNAGGSKEGSLIFTLRIGHLLVINAFAILLFKWHWLLGAAISATLLAPLMAGASFFAKEKTRVGTGVMLLYCVWALYIASITWALWFRYR